MRHALCGLILGMFLGMGGPAAAIDLTSSEVINVEGRVEVKNTTTPEFVPLNSNLRLVGAFKKHKGSGAEIGLKDTCLIAPKENSHFEVPPTAGESAIAQIKAQEGSFLFKVVSGQPFSVQTADVVAGVKGTLFEVDILNGLDLMLAFPGIELGEMQAGATSVNVYEGEVELNNPVSGQRRRLTRGQRIAVFNKILQRAHASFASGFGAVGQFDPAKRLQERFGMLGQRLMELSSRRDQLLQGLQGLTPGGLSMPFRRAQRLEHLQEVMKGMPNEAMGKLFEKGLFGRRLERRLQKLQNLPKVADFFKNFLGEQAAPSFPTTVYPLLNRDASVPADRVSEFHLGEGMFIAAQAIPQTPALVVGPEQEGIKMRQGMGSFRVKSLSPTHARLDALINSYQSGPQHITLIQVLEGQLHARLDGYTETFGLDPGVYAFSYAKGAPKTLRVAPPAQMGFMPTVVNHRFTAEQRTAQNQPDPRQQLQKQRQNLDKLRRLLPRNRPQRMPRLKLW